ncbi:MAG: hypothetical protein FWD17_19625 [Polyangiaceae bacterium]|nr:hypothetical protein [Polyangiaceae bacterium]
MKPQFAILCPSFNGQWWHYAVDHRQGTIRIWRTRSAAASHLRRACPAWHAAGARVVPFNGEIEGPLELDAETVSRMFDRSSRDAHMARNEPSRRARRSGK